MVLCELSDEDVFRSDSEGVVLEVLRGVEELPERGFLFLSLEKRQGLAVLLPEEDLPVQALTEKSSAASEVLGREGAQVSLRPGRRSLHQVDVTTNSSARIRCSPGEILSSRNSSYLRQPRSTKAKSLLLEVLLDHLLRVQAAVRSLQSFAKFDRCALHELHVEGSRCVPSLLSEA